MKRISGLIVVMVFATGVAMTVPTPAFALAETCTIDQGLPSACTCRDKVGHVGNLWTARCDTADGRFVGLTCTSLSGSSGPWTCRTPNSYGDEPPPLLPVPDPIITPPEQDTDLCLAHWAVRVQQVPTTDMTLIFNYGDRTGETRYTIPQGDGTLTFTYSNTFAPRSEDATYTQRATLINTGRSAFATTHHAGGPPTTSRPTRQDDSN